LETGCSWAILWVKEIIKRSSSKNLDVKSCDGFSIGSYLPQRKTSVAGYF
jgi:hypothetical protein